MYARPVPTDPGSPGKRRQSRSIRYHQHEMNVFRQRPLPEESHMRSGTIPRINGERLLQRLHDLAQIGATTGGGVSRLALSDEDRAGRDLLASWMSAAGLDLRVDDVGNMTGYRQGRTAGPPVLIGSHADTVLQGGKYDGAYGVLGA